MSSQLKQPEELVKELPPASQAEVRDVVEPLLEKRRKKSANPLRQQWAGLLSGTRKVVDAIFSFTNRNIDFTEKFFVRVEMTEEFSFLVTKMSPYYDR